MIIPTHITGDYVPVPIVTLPQPDSASKPTSKPQSNVKANDPPRNGCLDLVDYHDNFVAIAKENAEPIAYWRAAIRKIAGQSSIVGFSMHGHLATQSLTDFACIELFQGESKQALKSSLQDALIQCECKNQTFYRVGVPFMNVNLTLIAIPLRFESALPIHAAVSFAMRPLNEAELCLPAERLQSLLLQAAMHVPTTPQPAQTISYESKALEQIGKISAYRDTREFCYALVGSLAKRYGCSKVSVGLAQNDTIRIHAISGVDQFKATSPGVVDIQQAMEEAYDANSIVSGQTLVTTKLARSMPIHERLATSTRSAIVSFPLQSGDDTIAVITLQREANVPFTDADIDGMQTLLAPFGPGIALSVRGDRSLLTHLKLAIEQTLHTIRQPKTKIGLMTRLAVASALLIFFLGWMPYRPATPCTIVPANLSQSIARFDMKLAESLVRSGDYVQAGQVLARFDTRELELERNRLIASRNQAEVDVRKALAASDPAAASLAKTVSHAFQCQLDAVESKIADCTLVAPTSGMVVEADLSTKVGQVFPQGELILAFAPMDQWELQLHVPERLARFIEKEQLGSFAPIATPGVKHSFRLESISGAAEIVDGKNVFIAKAVIEGSPQELRHGMQGVARTDTGWRPICWIALHGAYETLCDLFWL